MLGVSWFWFVGSVLTSQLPAYAEVYLGGSATLYILALALFSVGTGVGSMLCEKLSARTVEIGLVPLGAFGMTAFMLDLALSRTGTRSEEHTSELQSLMRISYAVFCLKKKTEITCNIVLVLKTTTHA